MFHVIGYSLDLCLQLQKGAYMSDLKLSDLRTFNLCSSLLSPCAFPHLFCSISRIQSLNNYWWFWLCAFVTIIDFNMNCCDISILWLIKHRKKYLLLSLQNTVEIRTVIKHKITRWTISHFEMEGKKISVKMTKTSCIVLVSKT